MDPGVTLSPTPPAATSISSHEAAVLEAIRATAFGSVEIVLHQSRIVQIVRTQKVQLADHERRGC